MDNRFDHLDRFLPPEPRPESRDAGEPGRHSDRPKHRRPRRVRRGGRARAARWIGTGLTLALALASVALAAAIVPSPDQPPGETRVRGVDVSLGTGSGPASPPRTSPERARVARRTKARRRPPRRYQRRLQVAAGSAVDPATMPPPPEPAAADSGSAGSRRSSERRSPAARLKQPPPPPAPPQTPLFHCVNDPGNEHYVTIDRARAGQLSAPRSRWECSVVGQVYASTGPGRVPIELDDGTAFVLEDRTDTEPESELAALYRHWVGYDWYYSDREADGGLVGFVAG